MSARPKVCCQEWLVRGGAVLLLLAAIAGGLFLLNSASQADTPTVSLQPLARMTAKNSLEIAVVVNHNQQNELNGQLRVELLDADGRVVHTSKKKIQQKAAQDVHVFKVAQQIQPADKLRIRTQFGERSREAPLQTILLAKPHETALSAGKEYFSGSPSALY